MKDKSITSAREVLKTALTKSFGNIPDALEKRIDRLDNIQIFKELLYQAVTCIKPEEF